MVRRFRMEARAAATVRHRYICPVYETDSVKGIHYLVMAFIEGDPLTVLIPDRTPAEPGRAAGIIRQLAEGMGEAHASGVLHRDLKPLNVLLDRQGQPVIVDFGLARKMTGVNPQLTVEGEVLGTPAYMAPEQVHAVGNIDCRCDVYSLGVILYELLAGRMPCEGPVGSVLAQVLQGKPEPPSTINPNIPPGLEAVCLKAMAAAPAARYQNMAELGEAHRALGRGVAEASSCGLLWRPSFATGAPTALAESRRRPPLSRPARRRRHGPRHLPVERRPPGRLVGVVADRRRRTAGPTAGRRTSPPSSRRPTAAGPAEAPRPAPGGTGGT